MRAFKCWLARPVGALLLTRPPPASPLPLCCSTAELDRAVATQQSLRQDVRLAVRTWGFEPKVQEHRSRLQCEQAAATLSLHGTRRYASVAITADSDAMATASSPRRLLSEQE